MQTVHLILIIAVVAISGVSASWEEDGCNEVICYKTGGNESHPNPRDKCSYCCCFESTLIGHHAIWRGCPFEMHYNAEARRCEGGGCETPKTCEEIGACSFDKSIPAPNDPTGCTFCCCQNGFAVTQRCPNFGGYFGQFDESKNICKPSKSCGKV